MIELKQAKQIAKRFVEKSHQFNGAELRDEAYKLYGAIPSFAFYLTEPESNDADIRPTGLPECLFVDKISGEIFVDRALI